MSTLIVDGPELDDVRSVTEDVWMALLGEDEILAPRPVPAGSPFDATGAWSATVTVTGGWQGVVTLELDGSERTLMLESEARIAPGVAHRLWNGGADDARIVQEFRRVS